MCITCASGLQCFGHTRRATVKGDKGPEVAGVCVVESHKDCIEYHNGQLAEDGHEGRLLPPLDAQVIEFIACAGTCTLSQTGLHECDTPTYRCLCLIRMYVCVYTCVCVCVRVCVRASLSLTFSLSLSLSLSLSAFVRVLAYVVLCCRATCRKRVRLHYHTTCHTHTHTVRAPTWARHAHTGRVRCRRGRKANGVG